MSNKSYEIGVKLEQYLVKNKIEYVTDDLAETLDRIIMTERDLIVVEEAVKLYFQIRGHSIDDPLGEFDRERKRLLEDLK